jgi:O-antigen ligase
MKLPLFTKSSILWYGILIFIFSIPLSQFFSTRIAVVVLLGSLLMNKNWATIFSKGWDVAIYLLVAICGLMYSENLNLGFSVLETSFSLFAVPFIFNAVESFDENKLIETLLTFVAALGCAGLICLVNALISFYQNGSYTSFFYYQFTNVLDFQPTYFAYFLSFGISVLIYFIHYKKGKFSTWVHVSLIVFFFAILMFTAGRTAYISMLFVFAFFILKFLFETKRSRNTTLSFVISVVLLICMLMINYFDANASFDLATNNNDYWERLTLWQSAIGANSDILFGVGTGDYKSVLNDYFLKHGLNHYAEANLNSHNQFIQSFLSNGLLGLTALLILLGRPLYLSIKFQNVLGIMTFFSFFIYGVTEVFLGRYQGVVFFSFLDQAFLSHYLFVNTTTTRVNKL